MLRYEGHYVGGIFFREGGNYEEGITSRDPGVPQCRGLGFRGLRV